MQDKDTTHQDFKTTASLQGGGLTKEMLLALTKNCKYSEVIFPSDLLNDSRITNEEKLLMVMIASHTCRVGFAQVCYVTLANLMQMKLKDLKKIFGNLKKLGYVTVTLGVETNGSIRLIWPYWTASEKRVFEAENHGYMKEV